MSDGEAHRERLRQLGLLDENSELVDADIAQLNRQSDTLQADYNLLVPLVQSFAERVDECLEAERFLREAVQTAESADLSDCRARVGEALSAQKDALMRVQVCEEKLRSELERLPPQKREKVQRFLGSTTATRTERVPLETFVDTE